MEGDGVAGRKWCNPGARLLSKGDIGELEWYFGHMWGVVRSSIA